MKKYIGCTDTPRLKAISQLTYFRLTLYSVGTALIGQAGKETSCISESN